MANTILDVITARKGPIWLSSSNGINNLLHTNSSNNAAPIVMATKNKNTIIGLLKCSAVMVISEYPVCGSQLNAVNMLVKNKPLKKVVLNARKNNTSVIPVLDVLIGRISTFFTLKKGMRTKKRLWPLLIE